MSDILDINKLNNLPHPLSVTLYGNDTRYDVYLICVETGLMKLHVGCMLDRNEFGMVKELIDANGIKYDPDDFWIED